VLIPLAPPAAWGGGTVLEVVEEAWERDPGQDPLLVVAGFGGIPVAVVATRDRGLAEELEVLDTSLYAVKTPYGWVLDFTVRLSAGEVFIAVPLESAMEFLEDIYRGGQVVVVIAHYSGLLSVVRASQIPVPPQEVEEILLLSRGAGPPLDPEAAVSYYLAHRAKLRPRALSGELQRGA